MCQKNVNIQFPLNYLIYLKTMNNTNNISFHSVNSGIQKVALYETKTRLLLVDSNDRETKFRCLEIDRTAGTELKFREYQIEYDARGIRSLVGTLGQCKKISAYGVLGFIRFMESYYMILVTKRTKCAAIGKHLIYTIKDTTMIRVLILDLSDPYAYTAGAHYSRLMFYFGSPVIILNLVKKRERRRHESILTADMTTSINYLNQFLPPQHRIRYHHFDMAKKSHGGNVMGSLAKFAENFVQKTGLFFKDLNDVSFQTGIVRVNCVDCLDRTNTAQFAIGKTALAYQLHRLGFFKYPPKLEFDSDCVTMLESLYEDHGDTLALQYGGSQLVHRIKTYRKTAAWTSQGNDFMQTLSRYYSNTFSDTEKQHSMNIFLGYFVPIEKKENIPIWDLPTDYFMHNTRKDIEKQLMSERPLTEWVSPFILKHLPNSTCDSNKMVDELIRVYSRDLEMIDYYSSYHIPYKWTSFEENIVFTISLMARCFTPKFRTNFSPFEPATRRTEGRGILKNPSLTGQSSTGSTQSSSSSDEDTSSEDESILESSTTQNISGTADDIEVTPKPVTFNTMFPSMKEVYRTTIEQPNKVDLSKYKQYAKIGAVLMSNAAMSTYNPKKPLLHRNKRAIDLVPLGNYGMDNYKQVVPPRVKRESIKIYEKYVELPDKVHNRSPSISDLDAIHKYFNMQNMHI